MTELETVTERLLKLREQRDYKNERLLTMRRSVKANSAMLEERAQALVDDQVLETPLSSVESELVEDIDVLTIALEKLGRKRVILASDKLKSDQREARGKHSKRLVKLQDSIDALVAELSNVKTIDMLYQCGRCNETLSIDRFRSSIGMRETVCEFR